jgi:hypothetical protein
MKPQYIGFHSPSQAHKQKPPRIFSASEMETIVDPAGKTTNNTIP